MRRLNLFLLMIAIQITACSSITPTKNPLSVIIQPTTSANPPPTTTPEDVNRVIELLRDEDWRKNEDIIGRMEFDNGLIEVIFQYGDGKYAVTYNPANPESLEFEIKHNNGVLGTDFLVDHGLDGKVDGWDTDPLYSLVMLMGLVASFQLTYEESNSVRDFVDYWQGEYDQAIQATLIALSSNERSDPSD